MRRSFLFAAAALLLFVLPAAAQTDNSAASPAEKLTSDYNQAMHAREWPKALAAAQQLVALSPSSLNLRQLASAQANSGAMDEALTTYDRALAAADQEEPTEGKPLNDWKDGLAKVYVGKGNAFLKLKRVPEAIESYNRAAELASNPGQAYFNICATLYNTGNMQAVPEACRKSLKADPARADAWFLLGSALFGNSATDAQGNFAVSAETRQALEKYLELAPDGPHAADVQAMLKMAK